MFKVEVIESFTLARFDELKNIQRKTREEKGRLFVGDIFECEQELADYLTKNNSLGRAFVKVIEIVPEVKDNEVKPKTRKAKTNENKEALVKTETKKTSKKTIAKKD